VIQLAKLDNPDLKIITVAGGEDKLECARTVGADKLLNYKTTNVEEALRSTALSTCESVHRYIQRQNFQTDCRTDTGIMLAEG